MKTKCIDSLESFMNKAIADNWRLYYDDVLDKNTLGIISEEYILNNKQQMFTPLLYQGKHITQCS